MEKHFRNEDGVELTAHNEIQASAYENEGYKAVSGKKSKVADTEFASEMTPNATSMGSANAHQSNALASAMDSAQASANASQSASSTYAQEFAQELGATSSEVANAQAKASAKAKANKVNKQD